MDEGRKEDEKLRRLEEDRRQVSEVQVLTWLIGVDFKYIFATPMK
jgi:hypothetical protein